MTSNEQRYVSVVFSTNHKCNERYDIYNKQYTYITYDRSIMANDIVIVCVAGMYKCVKVMSVSSKPPSGWNKLKKIVCRLDTTEHDHGWLHIEHDNHEIKQEIIEVEEKLANLRSRL